MPDDVASRRLMGLEEDGVVACEMRFRMLGLAALFGAFLLGNVDFWCFTGGLLGCSVVSMGLLSQARPDWTA